MFPKIHIYGNTAVSTYSLLISSAIIIALIVAYWECKRLKLPIYHFPGTAFYGILSGIVGAKLFDIIFFEWDLFLADPVQTLLSGSGWMFYGALLSGVAGGVFYLHLKGIPIFAPMDVTAFSFMVAHSIGRLGCFLSGCCYGHYTDSMTGIMFPGHTFRVHPTQLYESIPLFSAFIVLWFLRKRIVKPGIIFVIYLFFYSLLRFLVEFYREDAYSYGILDLSPSQYISLFLFMAAFVFLKMVLHRDIQPDSK